MNPLLIIGTAIVTGALIAYSLAVITEQRRHALSGFVLWFLSIGIVLDVTATAFMIAGSRRIPITVHGILGYTALLGMLIDTICIWRTVLGKRTISHALHRYTRYAYVWWVIAYFAGGFIALFRLY